MPYRSIIQNRRSHARLERAEAGTFPPTGPPTIIPPTKRGLPCGEGGLDRTQIPYLVQLLDDASVEVRQHVTEKLLSFGPGLEDELRQFEGSLNESQLEALRSLLRDQERTARRHEAWVSWQSLPTNAERLERAFEVLAEIQYDWTPPVKLGDLLDELATEFAKSGRPIDPLGLSRFLFITKKFTGNVDDYYNPLNSNLIHVLQTRTGIPITLSAVFMLVGHRVGLTIQGCNVPTHFLAKANVEGELLLFDCFNRGRVLTRSEVRKLRAALTPRFEFIVDEASSATTVMGRVVRNLINAYEMVEDMDRRDLMRNLLLAIEPDADV